MRKASETFSDPEMLLAEMLLGSEDRSHGTAIEVARATNWQATVEAAVRHEVLPTLTDRLILRGAWPSLPGSVVEKLAGSATSVDPVVLGLAARWNWSVHVRSLLEQFEVLLVELQCEGLDALPLKGLHQMRACWWAEPGARSLRDLDLLIRPEQVSAVLALAERLGYRPLGESPNGASARVRTFVPNVIAQRWKSPPEQRLSHHHLPAMTRAGFAGSLELHVEPVMRGTSEALSAAECWAASSPYALADDLAVRQIILHGVVVDCFVALHRLPLRAAADLCARVRCGSLPPVDFDAALGPLYDRSFGPATDLLLGLIRLVDHRIDVPAPRNQRWFDRWLKRRSAFAATIARPMISEPLAGFDRYRLANIYGPVALERPWRYRAQRMIDLAAEDEGRNAAG